MRVHKRQSRSSPIQHVLHSGKLSPAPGALALLQSTGRSAASLLARHMHGDFCDTCRDDAALNELAITDGSRIMSVYRLVDAEKLKATPKQKRSDLPTVWVITDGTNDDGKREYTTLLLPGGLKPDGNQPSTQRSKSSLSVSARLCRFANRARTDRQGDQSELSQTVYATVRFGRGVVFTSPP